MGVRLVNLFWRGISFDQFLLLFLTLIFHPWKLRQQRYVAILTYTTSHFPLPIKNTSLEVLVCELIHYIIRR